MFDPFSKIKVDWMGIRKPLIAVSILVLMAGLVSAVVRQAMPGGTGPFNLGVDFQGGSVLTVKFKDGKPTEDEIRKALQEKGLGESVIQASIDKDDEVLIKIPLLEGETDVTETKSTSTSISISNQDNDKDQSSDETDEAEEKSSEEQSATDTDEQKAEEEESSAEESGEDSKSAANTESEKKDNEKKSQDLNQVSKGREMVKTALNTFGTEAPSGTSLADAEGAKYKIVGTDSVGPVAGEQLRTQAIVATLLGMIGILLFIAFRYDWTYAAGAVIAVFHDVLITLAFFTIFQWEVSLTVLAALLTLVGFSVNDSIVIFDRIRENLTKRRGQSLYDLTNDSINQTMSRTIVTNGLVFLAVLALVLFGGEVLSGFSYALFVGAITGTYSTVAIASPIAIWWQSKLGEAKMKEQNVEKEKKLASAARRSVTRRPVSK